MDRTYKLEITDKYYNRMESFYSNWIGKPGADYTSDRQFYIPSEEVAKEY